MRENTGKAEGSLSAKEVAERKERCNAANLCFISLKPLTDETAFHIIGMKEDGQAGVLFSVLNIYGEGALKAINK